MKIEQEKLFSPITITLESREEAAAVRIALGNIDIDAYYLLNEKVQTQYHEIVLAIFTKLQGMKE